MTFRGFLIRLGFVAVVTWILVGFTGSFGWALYLALTPIAFHEILRPR
jgi:hypothetical protein